MKNLSMILMSLSLFTLACSETIVRPSEVEDIADGKIYWVDRVTTFGLHDGNFEAGLVRYIYVFQDGTFNYEEWMEIRPDGARVDLNLDRLSAIAGFYNVYAVDHEGYHYACERLPFPASWGYSHRDGNKYEYPRGGFHLSILNIHLTGVISGLVFNVEEFSKERLTEIRAGGAE